MIVAASSPRLVVRSCRPGRRCRRAVRLRPVLPRGAGARIRSRTRSTSCSGRSAPRPSRACRTGSGWCCRASSPSICPDPAATRRSACCRRDGHEMPIGLSKVTVGFPRVGINCAMCHAASFRAKPDDVPTIYPAAASHQTGEQEYLRFLIACASDPRFTADTILAEIAKNTQLSFIDRLLYRFAIIPGTKRGTAATARPGLVDARRGPDWGRGRIDPFNPVKFTHAQAAGRRDHRQLRHGAALESPPARRARRITGTA